MKNRYVSFVGCLLLAAILCAGRSSAQMVQYGKVVEMNSHGKPLAGASILVSSIRDCQPTSSGEHGEFLLNFDEHQVGDVVVGIRAQRYGYEVVNVHVTRDGWTLTTKDTLKIVMATSEKLMEARMKYYDMLEMACVDRYEATMSFLDGQYAWQKISSAEYQYWKGQADEELKQAYASMDANADRLARINEDDMSTDEMMLMQKVMANDMTGVVAMLAGGGSESVLQAYNDYSVASPMVENEVSVSGIDVFDGQDAPESDLTGQVSDSLQNNIRILQAYIDLFESEFADSSVKYARSCFYLGMLYKEIGSNEASEKYLAKALKMFDMLKELGSDCDSELEIIRENME